MSKTALLVVLIGVAGALGLGLVAAGLGPVAHRAAAQTAPSVAPAAFLPLAANAAEVVDAANAFLATLSEARRKVAQIELTPKLVARWSNFPGGSNLRNGVFFRELKEPQVAAALKVARLALSDEGFARFQEIRAADDLLGRLEGPRGPGRRGPGNGPGPGPDGPPPGGGPFESADANKDGKLSRDEAPGFLRDRFDQIDSNKDGFLSREEDLAFMRQRGPGGPGGSGGPGGGYSAANYMIAFLGKPSKTSPWILQLGGHHLAFNIHYKGAAGASSPYFIAVEPTSWKDAEGKTHAPLSPMRDAMYGLIHSLSTEQLERQTVGMHTARRIRDPRAEAETGTGSAAQRRCLSPFPTQRTATARKTETGTRPRCSSAKSPA